MKLPILGLILLLFNLQTKSNPICIEFYKYSVSKTNSKNLRVRYAPPKFWENDYDRKLAAGHTLGSFVPPNTKVIQLADENGNLWLFRGINRPYMRGFKNSSYIKDEFGYSYSLNPYIVNTWSHGFGIVLISKQNVYRDNLMFPGRINGDDSVNYATLDFSYGNKLTLETRMSQLILDEIKVPVDNENVVAIIDIPEFDAIARSFNYKEFPISDLIEKVLKSPKVKLYSSNFK